MEQGLPDSRQASIGSKRPTDNPSQANIAQLKMDQKVVNKNTSKNFSKPGMWWHWGPVGISTTTAASPKSALKIISQPTKDGV